MQVDDIRKFYEPLVSQDDAPVVVFSALWPFFRALKIPASEVPAQLTGMLRDLCPGGRSLLMPTFARGYKEGLCDLDNEPSQTGALSEYFRQSPTTRRSASAFFSFNIEGRDTDEVLALRPRYAWGDGSLYDWMEKKNAHFLMLGTHPTHCSYLHRLEWLIQDQITYRYNKEFSGRLIENGREISVTETLFVRSLEPELVNDFTMIYKPMCDGGLTVDLTEGIHLSHMRARDMRHACLPPMIEDPFLTVKNRADFEKDIRYVADH